MEILATLNGSTQQLTSTNLNQIVAAHDDELQGCLAALQDAQQTVKTGLAVKAILNRCGGIPPRHRRARLEYNLQLVGSHWQVFQEWTASQLHNLLLCTKPDIDLIVKDSAVRKSLERHMKGTPVSAGFLRNVRAILLESKTPVLEKLQASVRTDNHLSETQPSHSTNEASSLDDAANIDFEQQGLGIPQISRDAIDDTAQEIPSGDAIYYDVWHHSVPYFDLLNLPNGLVTQDSDTTE